MGKSIESLVGHKMMLSFLGTEPTPYVLNWLQNRVAGGITIFRYRNVESANQVRELTDTLNRSAVQNGDLPLLIAADHEGGQLMGLGNDLTPSPGNMALGATRSPELAFAVGQVMGTECAALGINVDYAPSCDVNSNPQNPVIGIRSFGEDPELVGEMAAALSSGLQDAGVVSVLKHFPGHGDTQDDSHHGIPVVDAGIERLWDVELRPFQDAIRAGAKMLMSAHVGIPVLNDGKIVPSTLSYPVLHTLLRERLGFNGVVVSDAMDMGAIKQGEAMGEDILEAAKANLDLFLMTDSEDSHEIAYNALLKGLQTKAISEATIKKSVNRILQLKKWVAQQKQPDMSVVRAKKHLEVVQDVANHAVTLVRNDARLLPLQLDTDAKVVVIVPEFKELTPADTSESEKQTLATALRHYHAHVDEFIVPHLPDAATIADLRERANQYDLIIVGTIEASRQQEQADLVKALLDTAVAVVPVAMRTPYDLMAYPEAKTYVCTYSIQEPAMKALAAALFGEIPFKGKLPTQIPGLYTFGHAITQ